MVRRIYVEKKPEYAVKAGELYEEITSFVGVKNMTGLRYLIRYDIEDIRPEIYKKACISVFSEPPVDLLYEEDFPKNETDLVFAVESLPGQFDQRADSAEQCIRFLNDSSKCVIRTAEVYCISGKISKSDAEKIENYVINPVDSRISDSVKPNTLIEKYDDPDDVKLFTGFIKMTEKELHSLYDSLGLAMTFKDFLHINDYFKKDEKRDPSVTEIRVLDTYWSDHCRHTTFSTELKNITFEEGYYRKPIEDAFREYLKIRNNYYGDRQAEKGGDKYIDLMDLGTLAAKELKKQGRLKDQEESNEINACSIVVPVTVKAENGKTRTEDWLVMFKNETHNHPTEIEPFGGAATCLGGAIRDPLSGRSYVYQAMRVTGAADPTVPVIRTMKGKLPQKKLVRGAAKGYSSYGNQIGLATGYVKEIYHPDYVAKRMEIGAVVAAAPRKNVIREDAAPGDVVILLGGRTGRDGIGGATGASKVHTEASTTVCGAEVQKGNAPTERKLQRLFRRPEVSKLIKVCNDFGAGGVSVAIGELAPGLEIDLDKVPKKYAGLDGTELAISESQERMAVVVPPEDVDEFMRYASEENLEATETARVTKEPRLRMTWRGKRIVDLKRSFLDTNGAHQETDVKVVMPDEKKAYFREMVSVKDVKKKWLDTVSDLNECSQKGLVEMFDSSIGAATVLMPYGGKYQTTPIQTMAAKLPAPEGEETDSATLMSYGFDPFISSWSPYHGAVYAVTDSIAKIISAGGDMRRIRFTFQEYFKRMTEDPKRWSAPFTALLGAFDAQIQYGLPSIGGKDSMSGTFEKIDVPPTLVSFALDVASSKDIISPELKEAGNLIVKFTIPIDEYDLPVYKDVSKLYQGITKAIGKKAILSAYALDEKGIAPALSKMAFGNMIGVTLDKGLLAEELFLSETGNIIAEVKADKKDDIKVPYRVIGRTVKSPYITYKETKIRLSEIQADYDRTLEKVFPTKSTDVKDRLPDFLADASSVHICRHKTARPKVFIPVMPGTNCEYDTARAFIKAGADTEIGVFGNLSSGMIRESVEAYVKNIRDAQIIMFPGGFSAGDEPDGSAKFFATAFRNEKIREAVQELIDKRDGLVLGICNGFQAVIKLGLVPYGSVIDAQKEDSPTLTFNTINRHVSKMVYTKVVSNRSPWLREAKPGGVYVNPASHGEGRFVASKEWIDRLSLNGQIATKYCDADGNITMDEYWNVNGSYEAIEGILSSDGRVFGKMCHIERKGDRVAVNITGEQDMKVFESGVEYFK
ncbi:MAG: phosphoribosylformylglycinamidine synthase [Lachnospiraceae bacterium]|nr:phosphoribosylformylglycinamidine synthase [Lachnospiraceae bacterium]